MSGADRPPPPAGFAMAPGDGEAIWLGDALVLIRADAARTAGAVTVMEYLAPPGSGSPLHMHVREDEWFRVLEGSLSLWVGGRRLEVGAGGLAWCPRAVAHTYVVTSAQPARFMVVCEPGGFEGFVRAAGSPAAGPGLPVDPPPPDRACTAAAAREFGLEILGPPGLPPSG